MAFWSCRTGPKSTVSRWRGTPTHVAGLQGVESGRHIIAFHGLLAILIVQGAAFSPMERSRLPPRMRQMADVPRRSRGHRASVYEEPYSMPRYFFHLRCGGNEVSDPSGAEL